MTASLVIALARAYAWQQMLATGEYGSVHQLAAALRCDMSYVARTLNLAFVEAILHERITGLTLQSMPKNVSG